MASPKTVRAADLLGATELADLLGVPRMSVWNWRRRDLLPDPIAVLGGAPIWSKTQFPKAVRDSLPTSTTTRRNGTPRKRQKGGRSGSRK